MKIRNQFILLLLVLWSAISQIAAQGASHSNDSVPSVLSQRIGFEFRPNYIFPTNRTLRSGEHKKLDNQFYGMHLKYAFQFSPDSYLGAQYPNVWQGIGISYNAFGNNAVGNPIAVYAFQSARIAQITRRLSLNYEWNFGASFGWHPYNAESNPDNEIIGSKINAYINLGFALEWQINRFWMLKGGVGFSHFSNGNTHYPNAGLNTVEAQVGIAHQFESALPFKKNRADNSSADVLPHLSYDIVIYGATRKQFYKPETYIIPGSFGIAGININPMYNFNKYLGAGLSLDAQYDESANLQHNVAGYDEEGELRFYRPSVSEQLSLGVSLRAELVMPVFSINFGIGHNLLYRGDDLKGFYQILVLKTHITRSFYLHTGYQLSRFRTPKNLMLGIGYRFHNKRKRL